MKWLLAYIYTWAKKKDIKPVFNFNHTSSDLPVIGVVSLEESCTRENPRELVSDPSAADTVGFSGVHQDGSCLIARIIRRHGRVAEVLLYLCMPNGDEYVLPIHPDTFICNTAGSHFSAGGLAFEVLEPLRRWRVYFNGYLRKVNSSPTGSPGDSVLVKFNFIWHPIYCYMTFPQDFSIGSLAGQLARRNMSDFLPPWKLFPEEWHEQIGELHGIVNIEDTKEVEMFVRGLKIRKHGVNCWENVINKISIQGYLENGTAFHVFVENVEDGPENFAYGYVCPPCMMFIEHINKCNFNLASLYSTRQELNDIKIEFTTGKRKYSLQIKGKELGFLTNSGKEWNRQSSVTQISVLLNEKPGQGIFECVYRCSQLRPSAVQESLMALKEVTYNGMSESLVVSFKDEECKCSRIVGGKGASLALMTSIYGNAKQLFLVPDGVCVTNTAFMHHLSDHAHFRDVIHYIEKLTWKVSDGNLQAECDCLVSSMAATTLSTTLMNVLKRKLSDEFGADYEAVKFAVRSSALGEDGEEMSAAGQNETFLGIEKFDEICIAVQKCWASQFSYRSIEYKRQNGQPFSEGMGVVIQKMIPADASGVMFTKDPLTGSVSKLQIASNYGLGESVVSAAVDPDMITLQRTWDNRLKIAEKTIGNKNIMISMHDKLGTTESQVEESDARRCSISDDMALKLGQVGIFLENSFGNPRDIEWAVMDDIIYILQSRPIVTDGLMTDFEIIHEFDSAMRTDSEHYTTANVGEVMPGAQSPLTWGPLRVQLQFVQRLFAWRFTMHRFDPTISELYCSFYGHIMSERLQIQMFSRSEEKSSINKAMEVATCGRVLDDDKAIKMALERYQIKLPKSAGMQMAVFLLKGMFDAKGQLKKMVKKFQNYPNPTLGCTSVRQAYTSISKHLLDIGEVLFFHALISMASSTWNFLSLHLLRNGTEEYTLELYADFALLVGSCNGAESGDVPFSLKKLASAIAKEISPETFREMPPKMAYKWLQESATEAGKLFSYFLERHGHRGLKEFDLICTSWGMDPTELIKVLQNMLKYPLKDDKKTGEVNIIDRISTPLSSNKKRILSFIMKRCRAAVCYREQSKSCVIKCYDGIRLGYRHLAQLMMQEGLLPDPSLIFFFTHEEIDVLIRTRSPKIIRRAKHRARVYPFMERLGFEEMIEGYPIPIQEQEHVFTGEVVEVKGYPVSQGIIQAPARVVVSFLEVNTIQPGEILITVGTDIGWSPYFPILSGVVTELGGLISHGAVVAREFGLPCIVGAQNATRIFKSGDVVLLNATTGVLTKVG